MFFYILLAILVFLFTISITQYQNSTLLKSQSILSINNVLVIVVLTSFIIFAFLQDDIYDLVGYKNSFRMFANLSWSSIGRVLEGKKDPVYYFTTFLFAKFGIDYRMWRTLIAAIFSLSLYKAISKFSTNPFLSLIVTISLGLYSFTLTGLRQTLAFSVLLFSYSSLKEKKFWKFILIVLLASCFHSTALTFLAAYPVYHLKESKRSVVILFAVGTILMINAQPVFQLYTSLTGTEFYNTYLEKTTTLSISGIIIYGSILIFCLVFGYKKGLSNSKLCHLLIVSFLFRVLSATFFAEMFRLSMYYSLFDCILLAEICSHNETLTQNSKIKTILVSTVLLIYFIVSPASMIVDFAFRHGGLF